jgi:hypothetical protein
MIPSWRQFSQNNETSASVEVGPSGIIKLFNHAIISLCHRAIQYHETLPQCHHASCHRAIIPPCHHAIMP